MWVLTSVEYLMSDLEEGIHLVGWAGCRTRQVPWECSSPWMF